MESGLAYLEVAENQDPLNLLKEWIETYKKYANAKGAIFSLATSTKNGEVSNRNLLLRELREDSFCLSTNGNSKKIAQIKENPKVAASFYFTYRKSGLIYDCQVLVEGVAEILPQEDAKMQYDRGPLFCKIRSQICDQGKEIEWNDLKKKHDAVLADVVANKNNLEMPAYQVSYKIVPNCMDFYYAFDNHIADRVMFKKDKLGKWSFKHIAA